MSSVLAEPAETPPSAAGARRRWALASFGALTAFIGIAVTGAALMAPLKAQLGYLLLERAWSESLERRSDLETRSPAAETAPVTGPRIAPWPGADIAPIARISFPSLGESRIVLDEASNEAMAWGPGHMRGSAELGAPGLSAVAAHRDTHFALLAKLGPGDPVTLDLGDQAPRRYVVDGASVVDSRTWRMPVITEGPDLLALSTCWPLDQLTPGPERLIVFARPVDGAATARRVLGAGL